MNPKDWPEPEVYRPERFIDEEGKVFGKDRIIPFSIGKQSNIKCLVRAMYNSNY